MVSVVTTNAGGQIGSSLMSMDTQAEFEQAMADAGAEDEKVIGFAQVKDPQIEALLVLMGHNQEFCDAVEHLLTMNFIQGMNYGPQQAKGEKKSSESGIKPAFDTSDIPFNDCGKPEPDESS